MDRSIDKLMNNWTCRWTACSFWLNQFCNCPKRDLQPRRPMLEFVTNFINRLLEQMNIKEHFQFLLRARKQIGFTHNFKIRTKINRADPAIPEPGPGLELRQP